MAWLRSMAISFSVFNQSAVKKRILQDLIVKKKNARMSCYNRTAAKFLENFYFSRHKADKVTCQRKRSGKSTHPPPLRHQKAGYTSKLSYIKP